MLSRFDTTCNMVKKFEQNKTQLMDLKNRGKETPCYLLEGLADFLGLELTAEMFELSVRKFPLTNDVLWRLLPVVPGSHSCRI